MSWGVHVADVVAHIAQCTEIDCEWVGTLTDDRRLAERERDSHVELHAQRWRKLNEEWDRAVRVPQDHDDYGRRGD